MYAWNSWYKCAWKRTTAAYKGLDSATFIFRQIYIIVFKIKALRGKVPNIYYSGPVHYFGPEQHGHIRRVPYNGESSEAFAIAISNFKGVITLLCHNNIQV